MGRGQQPQVLKGTSLNEACGEELGSKPFSLSSGKSIPRMADRQASAHLPAGLTPTCAWRLCSAHLIYRGWIPDFNVQGHL